MVQNLDICGVGPVRCTFRQCAGCGAIMQDRTAELARALSATYRLYSNYTGFGNPSRLEPEQNVAAVRLEHLLVQRGVSAGDLVYEVGCGSGSNLDYYARRGYRVAGCDPSAENIEIARRAFGLDLDVGFDSAMLPLKGKPPRVISMLHVIEHLERPLESLERVHQSLNESGFFCGELPFLGPPENTRGCFLAFEHLSYMTIESMRVLLARAGFHLVDYQVCEQNEYDFPVLTFLAVKDRAARLAPQPAPQYGEAYHAWINNLFRGIGDRLETRTEGASRLWCIGAGVFASLTMAFTGIHNRLPVSFVDSSLAKQGRELYGTTVVDFTAFLAERRPTDKVFISSIHSQAELAAKLTATGVHPDDIILPS